MEIGAVRELQCRWQELRVGRGPTDVRLADMDRDGQPDLILEDERAMAARLRAHFEAAIGLALETAPRS